MKTHQFAYKLARRLLCLCRYHLLSTLRVGGRNSTLNKVINFPNLLFTLFLWSPLTISIPIVRKLNFLFPCKFGCTPKSLWGLNTYAGSSSEETRAQHSNGQRDIGILYNGYFWQNKKCKYKQNVLFPKNHFKLNLQPKAPVYFQLLCRLVCILLTRSAESYTIHSLDDFICFINGWFFCNFPYKDTE